MTSRRLLVAAAVALSAAIASFFFLVRRHWDRALDSPATSVAGNREAAAATPECYLTDASATAGINFTHEAGARGEMLNPETFGPGAGWFDYDGDGWIDLLLVNGNTLRGEPDPKILPKLYKNLGDGRFVDMTAQAGLAVPLYGMGFAAADVDNDGDQDLLLYGLHRSLFFVNKGGKRFQDLSRESGLERLKGWVCAAAFLDYDRDGKLDLYIGNYVQWDPKLEEGLDCSFGGGAKKYCPVAYFNPSPPQLFRGRGDGSFEETTQAAGLAQLKGKTLGVAVEDYDRDGWPDIFVANDSVPNFLLHNRANGTFQDRGVESGFATDAEGAALAGMGIDTAWAPNDGPLWIAVGNFSGEPTTLHVQEEGIYFVDRSFPMGIAESTLVMVTFGLLLHDHDLDGRLDLALANGHVFDIEETTRVPYRQPAQLFLGRHSDRFALVRPEDPEHILRRPLLGRALACADYDRDGDLDLVLTENQGLARLLRNDVPAPSRYVRIDLRGTVSARDAFGAEVTLWTRRPGPSGDMEARSVRRTKKSSSSYLSRSEPQICFGLAPKEEPTEVVVRWPSGRLERFAQPPVGRETLLVEGRGEAVGTEAMSNMAKRAQTASAGSLPSSAANSIAERQRGLRLLEERRYAEAAAVSEKAIALDPHDFAAHRLHLVAAAEAGQAQKVEARLREILRTFPSSNLLVSHFAQVLRQGGQRALAERLYEEAARLDPRRADIWLALGDFAFDRRDLPAALERYQRALSLKPDAVVALANAGKIHALRRERTQAIAYLEKALAVRRGYAPALSTLGGVLAEEGDLVRAEEKLLEALENPSSGEKDVLLEIHGNLGILYYKQRDRKRAIAAFERVLEIDPNDRQARMLIERLSKVPPQ